MMFFLPLWIVLVSVPCVFASARYTRNSLATLCVSFCFLLGGIIVLASLSDITGRVTVPYVHGLFVLELKRPALLSSLIFTICSMAFLAYYLPSLDGRALPGIAALIHALVFFTMASFFSGGLLPFAFCLAATAALMFALAMVQGKTKIVSSRNLLYLVPFAIFVVVAIIVRNV